MVIYIILVEDPEKGLWSPESVFSVEEAEAIQKQRTEEFGETVYILRSLIK